MQLTHHYSSPGVGIRNEHAPVPVHLNKNYISHAHFLPWSYLGQSWKS